jgi:hypothetical protein
MLVWDCTAFTGDFAARTMHHTGLTATEFAARLKHRSVSMNAVGATQFRLLTHYGAGRSACELALAAIEQVAQPASA